MRPPPKPYGFMPFSARARAWAGTACRSTRSTSRGRPGEFDFPTEFIELAGKVNQHMPYYCAERIGRALNEHRKPVSRERRADARRRLQGRRRRPPRVAGAEADRAAAASAAPRSPTTTRSSPTLRRGALDLDSVALTDELLAGADIVCVVTAHSGVDYARVAERAQLVLDFRNAVPAADGRVVKL